MNRPADVSSSIDPIRPPAARYSIPFLGFFPIGSLPHFVVTSFLLEFAPQGGNIMRKVLAIGSALAFTVALAAFATHAQQDKSKRPSPPATAKCDMPNGKSITVDYSSPRVKGRKIFGDVVHYGEPWRTGANEATTFVTTGDVMVGGQHVPAGSYTIFTVPNKDKWTLIVSKKTGEWGIPYPGADQDLVRADMNASTTSAPVENFTIAFDKGAKDCTLRIEWENTRATVAITGM
jgi:hypothetical protein